MKQIFSINGAYVDWLEDYITKINKRAVRLGKKEITYEKVGESLIDRENEDGYWEKVKFYDFEIEFELIKIEGYTVVAVIEHEYGSGNLVHKLKGVEVDIPSKYYSIGGNCEHCNTNRKRTKTVLLQDEQGNFKQIGRSCLKDFIGYDVEHQLKYGSLINEMSKEIEDYEGGFGGARYVRYIDLAKFLTVVEGAIKEDGWVSKSSVMHVEESTAYQSLIKMDYMLANGQEITPTESVTSAIEWIRNVGETSNEYMTNLKIICDNDYIREKDYGFGASLVIAYNKYLDRVKKERQLAEQKGATANSKHIGVVGKRLDFNVIVDKVVSFDHMYGTTYINIMRDRDGNVLVWKGSKPLKDEGEYILKGTIKEHTVYDGINQTILTRCAVVEKL